MKHFKCKLFRHGVEKRKHGKGFGPCWSGPCGDMMQGGPECGHPGKHHKRGHHGHHGHHGHNWHGHHERHGHHGHRFGHHGHWPHGFEHGEERPEGCRRGQGKLGKHLKNWSKEELLMVLISVLEESTPKVTEVTESGTDQNQASKENADKEQSTEVPHASEQNETTDSEQQNK